MPMARRSGDMDMAEKRIRRRRTFTMADESYALLTQYAKVANTPRSRFLEHLIIMAEPILAWKPPPKHPWWKFWIRREAPQPLSLGLVVDAERPRLQ